ncbi:hypothetical protein QH639_20955 [Lysinibacillus sp. 1 U-2021]|uniref:hypothetical protein n=1 Tax=Lysinibacillus sp. 1 U-2021 TaxID=3039426 RepID=UPI002480E37D|nr:hypothetical protein [Lysinibacillus sp. 1 U-2021]WGT38258.1 hypothetical protein QH639_20955 [Lysinibacillus sp. 1 U-2021]
MIVLMCYENNNHLFKVKSNCIDGISCPICKGPAGPTQVDKSDLKKIPFYEELKQYQHKAECLSCGHSETIFCTKKEYREVSVCPKCNGALVDVWKLHKYRNNVNNRNEKPSKSLSISVDMNIDKMQLKLRAIAKHTEALADELDSIDNGIECPVTRGS